MSDPIRAHLVAGGKFHDIDFARVELLKLLGENSEIRTTVGPDYSDLRALARADFLVTYTCDVGASEEEQKSLRDFVSSGGRWLALHGTNSVFEFLQDGIAASEDCPILIDVLGSQFQGHPPIGRFHVDVVAPHHPLVAGIEPFDVEDELYLCTYGHGLVPLLETRFTGEAPGFKAHTWSDDEPRLVMYTHAVGAGEVVYLTLGHCRGKYDMQPIMDEYPQVERCAWEEPVFYELLRRGLAWAAGAERTR